MDQDAIQKRIIDICSREMEMEYEKAYDVAFHMTDWLEDFAKLHRFFSDPDRCLDDEVQDAIQAFLIHAPNHIATAAKLVTQIGVADIFEVGAVEPAEEET